MTFKEKLQKSIENNKQREKTSIKFQIKAWCESTAQEGYNGLTLSKAPWNPNAEAYICSKGEFHPKVWDCAKSAEIKDFIENELGLGYKKTLFGKIKIFW